MTKKKHKSHRKTNRYSQRMIITIALCVCVCPGKELLGAVYIFENKNDERRTKTNSLTKKPDSIPALCFSYKTTKLQI